MIPGMTEEEYKKMVADYFCAAREKFNRRDKIRKYMQIGLLGLLGMVFVVLKLVGVIAWSWWLVLVPFYAQLVIFVVAFMVGMLTPGMCRK